MAKGTITFTDGDDGLVNCRIEFDPPLVVNPKVESDQPSPAQLALLDKWQKLSELADEEGDEWIDED